MGITNFVMVLVVYGSNGNKLKIWQKVDWIFSISTASIFIRDYYLRYKNFLSLSSKELVIVSPVITVHTLSKKGEIKIVSVVTRLFNSLVPWHSLNWLNGWGSENFFDVGCWNSCRQKQGGGKLLRYKERES